MTDITMTKSITKSKLSVKVQTLAAIAAVIAAVAIPQLFHAVGIISGAGTVPGETFLPMHLPIILVGLLAGPYAGIAAGLLGPAASFAMSGMPVAAMLPFMAIELGMYGLTAGAMRNVKIPVIGKVVITQIAGRAVKAAAIAFAVYVIGSDSVALSVIWSSIVAGVPGLILQWTMLPLIVFWIENRGNTVNE